MNKTKIPVSVIIPTYNRSALLSRALLSVLRQTVNCEEIIIVDDGSTDETRDTLSALLEAHQEIEVRLYSQGNRGPAAARNHGIEKARCEIIAFLDSDDHWLKNKLQKQHYIMEKNPEYSISHTRERWLRCGQHLNQKKRHISSHGDIFNQCLQLCTVGMSTVMLRKNIFRRVGLFDESMLCCEDYDMWLRISCQFPFLLVDEPLTVKEGGREDQVSHQYRTGMDRFRIDSLLRLLQSGVLSEPRQKAARLELIMKCRVYGQGCLKYNKVEEGCHLLSLAAALETDSQSLNDQLCQ